MKGVVYFRGLFNLTRTYARGEEELSKDLKSQDFIRKTLYSLEKKVRSIPGVREVIFHLLNWKKERGQWVPLREKKRVTGVPYSGTGQNPEEKWTFVQKEGEGVIKEIEKEEWED